MKKFLLGFKWAFAGIVYGVATQRNMRVHFLFMLLALVLNIWLNLNYLEWAIIILTISFVISAEMVNTSIEATLDRVSTEHHPLTKTAKDVAAGAVLISAIASIIIGVLIWGPHLWEKILYFL